MKFLISLTILLASCGGHNIQTLDDLEGKQLVLNKVCAISLDKFRSPKIEDLWQVEVVCRGEYNVDTLRFEGHELTCTQYNTNFLDRHKISPDYLDEKGIDSLCEIDFLNNRVFYLFGPTDLEEMIAGLKRRGINRGFTVEDEAGDIRHLKSMQVIDRRREIK